MFNFTEEQIRSALIRTNNWNGGSWNTPLKNLTYSFGGSEIPYWKGIDYFVGKVQENTFVSLSQGQKDAFEAAVDIWKSVANIDLTAGTPYTVTTDPTTLSFGDIVIVGGDLSSGILGSTISPTSVRSADSAGDIVIGNHADNNLLGLGQTGFNTFVHELGHALGLDHPFHGDGNALSQKYTVMSYIPVTGIPDFPEWYPSKPMLYDILAIQTLYGPNPTNHADDDTYHFMTGVDAVQALWDAGGTDTIDSQHILSILWTTFLLMVVGCAADPPILTFRELGAQVTDHYQIELYQDGTVHFHGNWNAINVTGDRYGKITPEQVQKMVYLYKKVNENWQQMLAEFFWPKYEQRHTLSREKREELERYKKNYIDTPYGNTWITFNDGNEILKYAPVGALFNDFIGILNDMIDMEPWLCLPKPDPRRVNCPIFNHSTNYHLLMERIK